MKYAFMLLKLVPVFMDIIMKIEEVLPEKHKGAEKLALFRGIVEKLYPDLMKMWDIIETLVATIVRFFNDNGAFEKKAERPAKPELD